MDDSLLLHLAEYGLLTPLPARNPWQRLAMYESSELVQAALSERHGKAADADRAREVAAHVTQARQYFDAADHTPTLIRPLLLYYGVLALSRAVILCSGTSPVATGTLGGHGLSTGRWSDQLANGLSELPNIEMTALKGTFTDLARATGNVERVLVYGSHKLRSSLVQEGTASYAGGSDRLRFTMRDVLARIPDLVETFEGAMQAFSACHPAYVQRHPGLQTDYFLVPTRRGLPEVDHIRNSLGLHPAVEIQSNDFHHWLGEVPGLSFMIHVENSPREMQEYEAPLKNDGRAIPYVVEPLSGNIRLSSLSLLFAASYAMGMLVRYYPSQWAALAGQSPGNQMMPILNAAASLIHRRFPALVLDEIEQTYPGARLYRHPLLA